MRYLQLGLRNPLVILAYVWVCDQVSFGVWIRTSALVMHWVSTSHTLRATHGPEVCLPVVELDRQDAPVR